MAMMFVAGFVSVTMAGYVDIVYTVNTRHSVNMPSLVSHTTSAYDNIGWRHNSTLAMVDINTST